MAMSLQIPISMSIPASSSSLSLRSRKVGNFKTLCYINVKNSAKISFPPINPKDPFLSKLASVAATSPETFLKRPTNSDTPPLLDLFESPTLMATPAQVLYLSLFYMCLSVLLHMYLFVGGLVRNLQNFQVFNWRRDTTNFFNCKELSNSLSYGGHLQISDYPYMQDIVFLIDYVSFVSPDD